MRKKILITGGIIALVLVCIPFFHSYHTPPRPIAAQKQWPAKVSQLGEWIDEQSAKYDDAQQRYDEATKLLTQASTDRTAAKEASAGYRMVLCSEFKLQKAAGNKQGNYFVNATTDCSNFQSGTLPAL